MPRLRFGFPWDNHVSMFKLFPRGCIRAFGRNGRGSAGCSNRDTLTPTLSRQGRGRKTTSESEGSRGEFEALQTSTPLTNNGEAANQHLPLPSREREGVRGGPT